MLCLLDLMVLSIMRMLAATGLVGRHGLHHSNAGCLLLLMCFVFMIKLGQFWKTYLSTIFFKICDIGPGIHCTFVLHVDKLKNGESMKK